MPYLRVEIVRFVDDYQPGIVACEFADVNGLIHTIIDKSPLFTVSSLSWDSPYPLWGDVQCEVLRSFEDSRGRPLVQISLAKPYALVTTDGLSEHVVFAESILPSAPEA